MAAFLISALIFSCGMGFGAVLHESDLQKVHSIKKLGK